MRQPQATKPYDLVTARSRQPTAGLVNAGKVCFARVRITISELQLTVDGGVFELPTARTFQSEDAMRLAIEKCRRAQGRQLSLKRKVVMQHRRIPVLSKCLVVRHQEWCWESAGIVRPGGNDIAESVRALLILLF